MEEGSGARRGRDVAARVTATSSVEIDRGAGDGAARAAPTRSAGLPARGLSIRSSGWVPGKMRGEAPEPDFSIEAIAQAAAWSVREREGYRARLRARGVPRDTLLGWDRVIEEHRTVPHAASLQRTTQTESTLSECTRMAYQKLLRSWSSSWSGGVRTSEIIKAIAQDGLDELADALRELAGTKERIPTATALGNALKWVRGQSVEGRKLTRVLDRNGIALWRVVRDE
jgi:hypothetical protein